ncbi:DUF2917 domain-containing protein [Caballeronia sp. 15715]|jgi:hypothetical protein|uniref:DUF2917 domain-containing protein n=1 Tax=unclassified Caballeronia TaxID=2646786 RepID=UPI0039E7292D
MREIRTLEQEPHDAPACWLIDRPHTLTVCRGTVWLTIEGESEDWWLREGETLELAPRSKVWISTSEPNSRFVLASAPVFSPTRKFAFYWLLIRFGQRRTRAM